MARAKKAKPDKEERLNTLILKKNFAKIEMKK